MRDAEKTIGNLIDKQGVSFISSVDADGYPNTKAMLPPRRREGLRVFYFTTNTSSMRVSQYRKNPRACIYFCDRRFFRGVMLSLIHISLFKTAIFTVVEPISIPKVLCKFICAGKTPASLSKKVYIWAY